MSDKNVVIRTRKFMGNPLLNRRQFVVEVAHPNLPNVSKADLQKKIAAMYKVQDDSTVFLFGFKTAFGGGRSTGFGLIYDTPAFAKKFEPKYRLIRSGYLKAVATSRKQRKERKNREKKTRGTGKNKKQKESDSKKKK